MDTQPVPSVTADDVERVVCRDFPEEHSAAVMDILNEYRNPRVQLAVLKLANGSLNDLRRYVETAKRDYRDVLAWAEYPGYVERGFGEMRKLSADERKRMKATGPSTRHG